MESRPSTEAARDASGALILVIDIAIILTFAVLVVVAILVAPTEPDPVLHSKDYLGPVPQAGLEPPLVNPPNLGHGLLVLGFWLVVCRFLYRGSPLAQLFVIAVMVYRLLGLVPTLLRLLEVGSVGWASFTLCLICADGFVAVTLLTPRVNRVLDANRQRPTRWEERLRQVRPESLDPRVPYGVTVPPWRGEPLWEMGDGEGGPARIVNDLSESPAEESPNGRTST